MLLDFPQSIDSLGASTPLNTVFSSVTLVIFYLNY
jgi:hypothetical protein